MGVVAVVKVPFTVSVAVVAVLVPVKLVRVSDRVVAVVAVNVDAVVVLDSVVIVEDFVAEVDDSVTVNVVVEDVVVVWATVHFGVFDATHELS